MAGVSISAAMRTRLDLGFAKLVLLSRWVMAPLSLGLIAALIIDLLEFCRELVHVVLGFPEMTGGEVTLAVLKLIDLVLIANLALMILGAAVGAFAPPTPDADRGGTEAGIANFGELKVRIFGYISAIAAIDLLESFINIEALKKDDLLFQIAILIAFVVSGVLLAWTERLAERH